jgi:hypothetical protein
MEDDHVHSSSGQRESVRSECHDADWDVLVEQGIKVKHRELPSGPIVAHNQLTAEEATKNMDEILHLRGGDALDAEGVEERLYAAS